MAKNISTKDLRLSSNERLFIKEDFPKLFRFPVVKNFLPKDIIFYTFNAGFKKKMDDLLIVFFKNPVPVAAAYSRTSTPSAPIIWDKKKNKGLCKLLIINSGNANAHTGSEGIKAINLYTKKASEYFGCPINQILVSSTGVIGEQLDVKKIIDVFSNIKNITQKDLYSAAKSIMTTDTYPKTILRKVKIKSNEINIFGIAKGSGMIFPNMGTMLAYIFIEANISKRILKNILSKHLDDSFNSISVDGDTSTSDTIMLFSSRSKENIDIISASDSKKISNIVKEVMFNLSQQVVSDGEGISKLMEINVIGAKTYKQASAVSFSIANSTLVKTAIAGQDANWGRVIMAIGKADLRINQNKIKLRFGNNLVASKGGMYKKINIKKLDLYMLNKKIQINVDLGIGKFKRTTYSSDLTHEYIRINGDYRS